MVRVFVIERRFHQTEGWDGAWTSPLECCAPQALVEKRPYIYMGGYDPKVIKNREKLHFFFRPPLFLLSTLGKTKEFRCKKRTAFLRTCRHFLTSHSQFPAIFTLIFRKISVVFTQNICGSFAQNLRRFCSNDGLSRNIWLKGQNICVPFAQNIFGTFARNISVLFARNLRCSPTKIPSA